MRVVLIATSAAPAQSALRDHGPTAMLPLVDRPFLQHVVELLASRGFREFDVILSHQPRPVETLLGDGTRWGVAIRYHLARDPARPYHLLRTMSPDWGDRPILLAHADRLPAAFPASSRPGDPRPTLFYQGGDPGPSSWTGWAWIGRAVVAGLAIDADFDGLAACLQVAAGADADARPQVSGLLDISTYEGLLDAQRQVLEKRFPGLQSSGREVEPGVWLARNVSLHPTARLVPPVSIAEDCRIGREVRLGPNVALGAGCIIDDRSEAADALIFPACYVGQGLDLVDTLVDHGRLISLRHGTETLVDDESLLAGLSTDAPRRVLFRVLSRLAAAGLLALTWPVLSATAIFLRLTRRGPALVPTTVVRLPAPPDPSQWETVRLWSFRGVGDEPEGPGSGSGAGCVRGLADLLLRVLPGLISVVRGELDLVGVTPRSEEAVRALPHVWQALVLRARAGLITEAVLFPEDSLGVDERDAADACYAALAGPGHDLALLIAYAKQLGRLPRRREPPLPVVSCPASEGGMR
jgi:lipopolysaccharide/colanic/teichoic acid biosynthesis glycosyltransferase